MFIVKGKKHRTLVWSFGVLENEEDEDTNDNREKELNTAEFKELYGNPLYQWFCTTVDGIKYTDIEFKGKNDVIVSRDEYQAYIDRIKEE